MKNIVFISLLIFWLCSCNDEKGWVHVDVPGDAFSFYPIAGGAVMHYILPDDPDIVGINVRYTSARGEDMLRVASSTCDSLILVGFDEAAENVPAEVTFYYADDRESQPIDVTFSTKDSGPVAFLKNVKVLPNWGGFALKYSNSPGATGMAHVCYLGIDPITQQPDTICIESFVLQETDGEEYVSYRLEQENISSPTVIIRAEDYRGYMFPQRVWPEIKFLEPKKLDPKYFSFFCDNSLEDGENDMVGAKYLFDGDTKGLLQWDNPGKCFSFIAGPDAAGDAAHPMYIDLKEDRMLGEFRIYTMLSHTYSPTFRGDGVAGIINRYNENEIPCEVTLYALSDDNKAPAASYEDINAMEGWEEIGHFEQSSSLSFTDRWCRDGILRIASLRKKSREELEAADDCYMSISIPADGKQYRYLKIVINEVFQIEYMDSAFPNRRKYVQFHELEILTD